MYGRITKAMMNAKLEWFAELMAHHMNVEIKDLNIRLENTAMSWWHLSVNNRTMVSGKYSDIFAWLVGSCETMRFIRDNKGRL